MSERDIQVGSRLKKIRQGRGLTQKELANKLKISQTAIALWENGSRSLSLEIIDDIAQILDVSAGYLLFGEADFKDAIEAPTTNKDTPHDIKEILANTEQLLKQDGLMFDGDPASPEAIESILSAMQIGMEMAKKRNKEKYTPKKYRKDTE